MTDLTLLGAISAFALAIVASTTLRRCRRRRERKRLLRLCYVAAHQGEVGLGRTCGYWELAELEDLGLLEGTSHENGQRSYHLTDAGAAFISRVQP